MDGVRERVAREIGVRKQDILINCSHTHSAPMFPGFQQQEPDQEELQRRYYDNLRELLAGVVSWANAKLRPVRVGMSRGKSYIGINRREVMEGKVVLGENPSGPMDPDVSVIRIDEVDGRPLAVLYSYGCHTVTMGPRSLKISPDFVGPASRVIEQGTGATALFLQGTAGDVNPICGIGADEDNSENMYRMGNSLGGEALKTAMDIRTHNRRGPRWFFGSLAKASTWTYVPVEGSGLEHFQVRSKTIELPLQELPSLKEAEEILRQKQDIYQKAQASGARESAIVIAERYHRWATILYESVRSGITRPTRAAEIHGIRINDIGLVSVPGEPLTELGLEVKKNSPLPNTIFLGYSNGCLCYLPPASAYPPSGWSVREAYHVPDMLFQGYLLPTALDPCCAQMIVDTSLEVLREMSEGRRG